MLPQNLHRQFQTTGFMAFGMLVIECLVITGALWQLACIRVCLILSFKQAFVELAVPAADVWFSGKSDRS